MKKRFRKQLSTLVSFFLTVTTFAGDFVKTSEEIVVRPDASFGGGHNSQLTSQ